jgi:hypothetical protein
MYLHIPRLSSTLLWLHCSNIFNPSKKNSFGCAANREIGKAKDLAATSPRSRRFKFQVARWYRSVMFWERESFRNVIICKLICRNCYINWSQTVCCAVGSGMCQWTVFLYKCMNRKEDEMTVVGTCYLVLHMVNVRPHYLVFPYILYKCMCASLWSMCVCVCVI